nr:hypothetical protein [Tanacetum cinerariifolium]
MTDVYSCITTEILDNDLVSDGYSRWQLLLSFIVDERDEQEDVEDTRRIHHRPRLITCEDEQEDVEALEREIQRDLLGIGQNMMMMIMKMMIRLSHEREVAVCLMQKCITKPAEMQIRSAIALDHLKNYIYIEAYKEAHVREACKGMRDVFTRSKIFLVPIKEMTDVLSVESKSIDISRDTWVRMKIGIYKGDLAKALNYSSFLVYTMPRDMHIRLERRRDPMTGDYFENINDMMFKDGFLYKTVSIKSIRYQSIHPTFDELEKFREPNEDGDGDIARNHVKVVSGAQDGVTGMVIAVEGHLVNIVSHTTKEALRVFSDNVVESSEVTSGISKIGDFELHDLVQLE